MRFRDEDGFTTLTVVVSLLLTLALIFSGAQVYRITSASADIQNVADASTQAAENKVAEFMILVKVSDAVVLSLGLGTLVTAGLSIVCMCTPVTAELSSSLMDIAKKLLDARNDFADKASNGLNALQKSLPFISSVSAYEVAKANNGGTFDANYLSIAMLFPSSGVDIKPGNTEAIKGVINDIDSHSDDIKQAANEAEEASKKALDAKQRAFMADCGNNPNYCMYERAKTKAHMSDATNPLYSSVDTWSFNVALNRSKEYYPRRLQIEKPEGSSVNEQSNSALRKVFYSFASSQIKKGYINDNVDFFDAYFPHIPKNTNEMRETELYTNYKFPISENVMHAYDGCPGCNSISSYGTVQQMESSSLSECPYCKFNASSLGKVAAASSSIDNGFEYHYSIVEQSAKEYKDAINKANPAKNKVKGMANGLFEKIKNVVKEIANKRIYAKPPGSYGAIVMVVNTNSAPSNKGFESSFVSNNSSLGIRAAVSAATLIEESTDEGKTVLNNILSGLTNNLPGIAGAGSLVLSCWSNLLQVYSKGQEEFIDAIKDTLNQIPLVSASGLGTWASKAITNILEDLGLEPVNLAPLKPVLINSFYVADKSSKEGMSFATKYLSIKESALKINEATNQVLSSLADPQELYAILNLDEAINLNGKIEIATIKPLGDWGPAIPITITLPKFATSTISNIVSSITGVIQSVLGNIWGGKVWR